MVSRSYVGDGAVEGLLSPVPEFTITREITRDHEGDRSDSKLPEFDEQDYNSKDYYTLHLYHI